MILSIDSLTYAYANGTPALNGVTFQVAAGERVAVVGSNGAGKSTLARHLVGIERPTSGTVEVEGRRTDELSIAELARSVGFVFQNPHDQLHARTVAKAVEFGPRNLGFTAEQRARACEWALRVTGLTHHAQDHPHHLSFGQRKRVALASVLAMDTPLVVLDEPTTGQDHRSLALLGSLLGELAEEGRTVIAVTHDMEFCVQHFERVIVLERGRVRWDGTVEQWLAADATALPADGGRDDAAERSGPPADLERPQLTRLARELGWSAPVATVDAFLSELRERTPSVPVN
ncbi:energy-coupling factor ABC transporter ATP-binding protein [Streptomyces cacaoi]